MQESKLTWKELSIKDKLQYITAIALFLSGIVIAFLNFFATNDIANGTLIYIGQAFISGGSIFGISIYFKDKLEETRKVTANLIKEAVSSGLKQKE